jgi:endonuclease I
MKHLIYIAMLCSAMLLAQAPTGYYSTANGLTGYALKTELSNIITNGYNERTYGELLTLYQTSDIDVYYENDNTILDMYSERPTAADSYSYAFNNNCGNVGNTEGVCYNREHIFPQGFFNSQLPMRSDAHHVIPTDGFVNGQRSNFPFGKVGGNPATFSNGSKRGASITPGFSGSVFEPIDEFKGDIARALFYISTRYEDVSLYNGWGSHTSGNDPRDGSINRWYEQWYVDLLLDWHALDPVSQKEIDRNNAIFAFQANRNPFVDNPIWITQIWTSMSVPSGSLFPTLRDTFVDVDNSGSATVGDRIDYTYSFVNLGSTTLFNITAVADFGTFATPGSVSSLAANQTSANAYGALSYTIVASDLNTSCNCLLNKIAVRANLNATGTNGSITVNSDDPDIFVNNDSNGDNLPDDLTRTNLPPGSGSGSTVSSELFISEYIEGSGENKAIELANFTGSSINLSQYSLQRDANGGGSWSGTIALSGSLPTGEVYVVTKTTANAAIRAQADLLVGSGTAMDFNGNDPVGLFKNGVLLDIIGTFGNSANFAENTTLIRKPAVTSPNTSFNLAAEWNSFNTDDSSNLGAHIFGSNASVADLLQNALRLYPNPSQGFFTISGLDTTMDVIIYDLAGRSVHFERQDNSISNLKSGLYIIKIVQDSRAAFIKAVVH